MILLFTVDKCICQLKHFSVTKIYNFLVSDEVITIKNIMSRILRRGIRILVHCDKLI